MQSQTCFNRMRAGLSSQKSAGQTQMTEWGDLAWSVLNSDGWGLVVIGITFVLLVYRPLFWFAFTGPGERDHARVTG